MYSYILLGLRGEVELEYRFDSLECLRGPAQFSSTGNAPCCLAGSLAIVYPSWVLARAGMAAMPSYAYGSNCVLSGQQTQALVVLPARLNTPWSPLIGARDSQDVAPWHSYNTQRSDDYFHILFACATSST
jgi:hypothetical protein